MAEAATAHWLDGVAVAGYLFLVLAVGFYSLFRSNRATISGYFLAGRFMTWLPVGASLFASNIGSEHFVGLAGSGAAQGIGVGAFELNALVFLQLLGWIFLPVYLASGCHTLPEFTRKRFGGQRIRVLLACVSMLLYIFTKISVNLYSGGLFVQRALGWNIWVAVILVLAIATLCTVTGGLAAVIYTDTLQCALMLLGGGLLAVVSLSQVGWFSGLMVQFPAALTITTGTPNTTFPFCPPLEEQQEKSFRMLRGPSDSDYPWPGFLFGQSPASIWYWAADQMMVQRALASKSLSHAQGATLFAGYLKILPLFIMVLPGMAARVRFPTTVGCSDAETCTNLCGNAQGCTNIAYPELVVNLLPVGVRGIMLAVMLSALVSDLSSIFNSSSTLFSIDIWHRIRAKASSRELLIVGRAWVVLMVLISLAWVPVVNSQQGSQLYVYIQMVAANLAPPIAAVYLLAILWKRTNEQGAFWGLMIGLVIGVIRLVINFSLPGPENCTKADTRPLFATVQYMYFAMFLFWTVVICCVVISLVTKPVEPFRLIRTTYWTRHDKTERADDARQEVDNEDDIIQKESCSGSPMVQSETIEMRSTSDEESSSAPLMERKKSSELRGREKGQQTACLRQAIRSYNWFCGYDYEATELTGQMNLAEFEAHLDKIKGIRQTRLERRILNVNLVILLSLCLTMYLFFSIVTPMIAKKYY